MPSEKSWIAPKNNIKINIGITPTEKKFHQISFATIKTNASKIEKAPSPIANITKINKGLDEDLVNPREA